MVEGGVSVAEGLEPVANALIRGRGSSTDFFGYFWQKWGDFGYFGK